MDIEKMERNVIKAANGVKYFVFLIVCFIGLYELYSVFYSHPPYMVGYGVHKVIKGISFLLLSLVALGVYRAKMKTIKTDKDGNDLSASN